MFIYILYYSKTGSIYLILVPIIVDPNWRYESLPRRVTPPIFEYNVRSASRTSRDSRNLDLESIGGKVTVYAPLGTNRGEIPCHTHSIYVSRQGASLNWLRHKIAPGDAAMVSAEFE